MLVRARGGRGGQVWDEVLAGPCGYVVVGGAVSMPCVSLEVEESGSFSGAWSAMVPEEGRGTPGPQ